MVFSELCQLNGGCMGCCGHDFGSNEQIITAIKKNTLEFKEAKPETKEEFITFRDRRKSSDLRMGVCRNLVDTSCIHCPLHPAIHKEDLRVGHCDINYLCATAEKFATWDEVKKKKFITFIEKRKLDNITYSVMMDNGKLLEEFE